MAILFSLLEQQLHTLDCRSSTTICHTVVAITLSHITMQAQHLHRDNIERWHDSGLWSPDLGAVWQLVAWPPMKPCIFTGQSVKNGSSITATSHECSPGPEVRQRNPDLHQRHPIWQLPLLDLRRDAVESDAGNGRPARCLRPTHRLAGPSLSWTGCLT